MPGGTDIFRRGGSKARVMAVPRSCSIRAGLFARRSSPRAARSFGHSGRELLGTPTKCRSGRFQPEISPPRSYFSRETRARAAKVEWPCATKGHFPRLNVGQKAIDRHLVGVTRSFVPPAHRPEAACTTCNRAACSEASPSRARSQAHRKPPTRKAAPPMDPRPPRDYLRAPCSPSSTWRRRSASVLTI